MARKTKKGTKGTSWFYSQSFHNNNLNDIPEHFSVRYREIAELVLQEAASPNSLLTLKERTFMVANRYHVNPQILLEFVEGGQQ